MGFSSKAPSPQPVPVPSSPSEPATSQAVADESIVDKDAKKRKQLREGKKALTVGLKTDASGINTGNNATTGTAGGLSVGGA